MKERSSTQGPRVAQTEEDAGRLERAAPSTDPAGTRAPQLPDAPADSVSPNDPASEVPAATRGSRDTDPTGPLTPASEHVSVDYHSQPEPGPNAPQPARRLDPRRLSSASAARYQPAASPAPSEDSNTTLQSLQRPDGRGFGAADTRRFRQLEREVEELSVALRLAQKEQVRARRLTRVALAIAGAALLLSALGTLL